MLSVARQTGLYQRAPIMRAPPDAASAPQALVLGRALAALRTRAGLSQAEAGENYGSSAQGWGKYERGLAPSIFHPETQQRLVEAVGATVEDLERERRILVGAPRAATVHELRAWPDADRSQMMLIRDRVQAGAWLMADDTSQVSPRRHPFARDPRYPHADQWLSEVCGDSVDQLGIFDGDLVHVVDFEGAGLALRNDQVVEVERIRFGGQERELSIKQVELTPQGPLLWPRSNNPHWKHPLSPTEGANDDVVVRIRGLVLNAIKRLS